VKTVSVEVQTLGGTSFVVKLDHLDYSVLCLKTAIQKLQGTACDSQDLFLTDGYSAGATSTAVPLVDSYQVRSPCSIVLCVKGLCKWNADSTSVVAGLLSLSGEDNSILTREIVKTKTGYAEITAGEVMQSGSHTISFKNLSERDGESESENEDEFGDDESFYCGITMHVQVNSNEVRSDSGDLERTMSMVNGSLWSHGDPVDDEWGYDPDDRADRIRCGQVLSIRVDLDTGSLKFWRDGVPHGVGFEDDETIMKGPVRWFAEVMHPDSSIQIVPTPELQ
jgi:hypothetical protein